jgi:hypothetical protein
MQKSIFAENSTPLWKNFVRRPTNTPNANVHRRSVLFLIQTQFHAEIECMQQMQAEILHLQSNLCHIEKKVCVDTGLGLPNGQLLTDLSFNDV